MVIDEKPLQLDHNVFALEIIYGTVTQAYTAAQQKKKKGASEDLGEAVHQSNDTVIKRKNEFWLESKDGKTYHFTLNNNSIALKKGQKVQILAGVKEYSAAAILIFKEDSEQIDTNINIFSLVYDERSKMNSALMLFAVIGIFFAFSPLFGVFYFGVLIFAAMYWIMRLQYYYKKLEIIKKDYLIKDVE